MTNFSRRLTNFHKIWETATNDHDLTLYGFRRFKTTHLLNLRFLEEEIAELDHVLYQAGLAFGTDHSPANRLGLKYCQKDVNVPKPADIITDDLVRKVRGLVREYGMSHVAQVIFVYTYKKDYQLSIRQMKL